MAIIKIIVFLLIISSTFVDARARRKRRQLSSASYYISNINPYSSSYNPSVPLTYASGSFYSNPSYGYPNTGYSGDQQYNSDYYGTDSIQYNPTNVVSPYGGVQYTNYGVNYGSGVYGSMGSGLYNYGPQGFNNQNPDWNQGNSNQYYTGGTGTGLVNTGFYWYRKNRNIPMRGGSNAGPVGLNAPVPSRNVPMRGGSNAGPIGLNAPVPSRNMLPNAPPGK